MKITRKQIRNIIQESLNEGTQKARFGEISNAIEDVLNMSPGVPGDEVAKYVMSDLSDYGMADPSMAIDKQEVFGVLDIMIEEGDVFFDIEEDRWYWAKSPEGMRAVQAMVNRT